MTKHNQDSDIQYEIKGSQCPFTIGSGIFLNLSNNIFKKFLIKVNFFGMKYFGKFWILQYLGSIYPFVLAHFPGQRPADKIFFGHKNSFHKATVVEGKSSSTYFLECGIDKYARQNGGICTFWMGFTPAIYQNKNIPLTYDENLAPPTSQNSSLFGDFMGTMPVNCKVRKMKRAAIEASLGNMSFMISLEEIILKQIYDLLSTYKDKKIDLENFCREIVADIDSLTPGILDFKIKPLSHYISSKKYKNITNSFFDIASDVISKLNQNATREFDTISPFVRDVLIKNYKSIKSAPDTNIIKRYFKIWDIPLTLSSIKKLTQSNLKELGTIIVAIYDTTSLSLSWALSYIEHNSLIKNKVINDSKNKINPKKLSYIDTVVFEALRLGGSNPTALWRKVETPFELQFGVHKIIVQRGTMMWLDRRNANQDDEIFPKPSLFDPKNIVSIVASDKENISSIMSRKRYEINSFSMINTINNPRKCPGRIFSVYIQSLILRVLYNNYKVQLSENNTDLRKHCAMPKQESPGFIQLTQI